MEKSDVFRINKFHLIEISLEKLKKRETLKYQVQIFAKMKPKFLVHYYQECQIFKL